MLLYKLELKRKKELKLTTNVKRQKHNKAYQTSKFKFLNWF